MLRTSVWILQQCQNVFQRTFSTNIGRKTCATRCLQCIAVSLGEISVDSVRPLYGPVSGGTRVTISGQYLTVSTVTVVYIGQHKVHPDTSRCVISCICNNSLPERLVKCGTVQTTGAALDGKMLPLYNLPHKMAAAFQGLITNAGLMAAGMSYSYSSQKQTTSLYVYT